jgi:menaquinone-dependent protoporphyrinogen oxidase
MSARVLMLCSSTDGQTRRICERLRELLHAAGHAVTLAMIEQAQALTPLGYDLAVVGARIRYGHTDPRVIAFANRHADALNAMPSAFFSVNIVARKPQKNRPETNPYVQAFLRRVRWRPRLLDVFAGKLDYPRYGPLDRQIIRLIMWMTDGPTQPDAVVEFTDWQRVEDFGRALCTLREPA